MERTSSPGATPDELWTRCLAGIDAAAVTRPQLVLASASPSRRQLLINAGVEPIVRVSNVDEEAIEASMPNASTSELALKLAKAKARAVAEEFANDPNTFVIGCDSILDIDGVAHGKPGTPTVAKQRWLAMAGNHGTLRTGHWLIGPNGEIGDVASSVVFHARITEAEMDAYIATGEPLRVAGGFTLEGLGAPFVERIEGDPSNVIGLSLPLLRTLLARLGVRWTDLWSPPPNP